MGEIDRGYKPHDQVPPEVPADLISLPEQLRDVQEGFGSPPHVYQLEDGTIVVSKEDLGTNYGIDFTREIKPEDL